MKNSPVRVILVDDHAIVLAGLRIALAQCNDLEVVGEATHAGAALKLAADTGAQVALLDIHLPGSDGFEIALRLREVSPETRVILLSSTFDNASIELALDLEVSGFLLKTEPPQVIADSIRGAMSGKRCFSKAIHKLLEPVGDDFRLSGRKGAKIAVLTTEERQMLVELAEGHALKQIAGRMKITYKSADHLKARVMKKLDVHDRVELTRLAIREGVVRVS